MTQQHPFIDGPIYEVTSDLPETSIPEPKNWEQYFKQITYRPGHEFFYNYMIDFDMEKISIIRDVEDTYNPGKIIRVSFSHLLPRYHTATEADCFVRNVLHEMERHEADEWFRRNGVMLFDPHAHDGIWGN